MWSSNVGTSDGNGSTRTLVLPVSIGGATAVHTLINTYAATNGTTPSSSVLCVPTGRHTTFC